MATSSDTPEAASAAISSDVSSSPAEMFVEATNVVVLPFNKINNSTGLYSLTILHRRLLKVLKVIS